jgi:pentatricopeptide repeat protein
MKEQVHYTLTMARVYAEQGHWEKAVEIYRYLLASEPDRQDLADALTEVQSRLEESAGPEAENLVPLFRRWLELMSRYDRLRKLKRIRRSSKESV